MLGSTSSTGSFPSNFPLLSNSDDFKACLRVSSWMALWVNWFFWKKNNYFLRWIWLKLIEPPQEWIHVIKQPAWSWFRIRESWASLGCAIKNRSCLGCGSLVGKWAKDPNIHQLHPRNLTNWYQKLPSLKGPVTFSKAHHFGALHVSFLECILTSFSGSIYSNLVTYTPSTKTPRSPPKIPQVLLVSAEAKKMWKASKSKVPKTTWDSEHYTLELGYSLVLPPSCTLISIVVWEISKYCWPQDKFRLASGGQHPS